MAKHHGLSEVWASCETADRMERMMSGGGFGGWSSDVILDAEVVKRLAERLDIDFGAAARIGMPSEWHMEHGKRHHRAGCGLGVRPRRFARR